MSEVRQATPVTAPSTEIDAKKLVHEIASATHLLQSLIDRQAGIARENAGDILTLLKQAQQVVLDAETRLQQSDAKLKAAQQLVQDSKELQTLLDTLPIGIAIAHDPQNQNMTMNPAGLKMLNLVPETNPSKSAPSANQLPFRVLRGGKEVPVAELPMQYATTHGVTLRDVELDIQHDSGKVINLLEYASPLFDEHGAIRGSVGILIDITARKVTEQRLVLQYHIAHILAESNSIYKATAQVLQMICETLGWEYGALWRVDPDSQGLTNEGVWHTEQANLAEYANAIRFSVLEKAETSLPGHVLHSGQPLWLPAIQDFATEDASEAAKAGLQSAYLLPVRSGNSIIAILECASNQHQIQDRNLTDMLNAVVRQIGVFLERKMLEEALAVRANQQHILAQMAMTLATTLDFEQRLIAIVRLAVPDLADWCAIDFIDQDQIVKRVAVAHVDPTKEKLVYEMQQPHRVDLSKGQDARADTLLSGKSLLFTEIPPGMVESTVTDPQQLERIRQLDARSFIVVPLIAHEQILGTCTFVYSDSRRRYTSSDLSLAEDIGRQAALALENGRLYAESQKLNAELEWRVEERTAQLKSAIAQLTLQITERQHAEERVRILNAELEQRIAERTSQLEVANKDLHQEVLDRQEANQRSTMLLTRTRELYRVSQAIGRVRSPNELLKSLLSTCYLKDVSRASIALLDKPWKKEGPRPEHCQILAEWNKGLRQPRFLGERLTLEEYGVTTHGAYGKPIVLQDIQSVKRLPEKVRNRFAALHTHGLIILPLVSSEELYGLLSLHFKTSRMTNMEDLHHVRGLVDKAAVAIKNMRLLEAESQARQEAEKANSVKLKFLGMISHELRTPLASIKGFATTLLADDVVWPPEKQREFLEIINTESDKLTDLIEQLLDLTRLEAGTLRISAKRVALDSVIEAALAQLQALSTEHRLVLQIPGELPAIHGDEVRIAQVLTNLVGNSAKFSPPGTPIVVSARVTDEMVQVDVADQGPGIPAQERPRVFEAFRQLESGGDRQSKGAGLGLAICKGLIEAQRGKIWIQDNPEPGTIISFTLPKDS